jgi:hypothetical protein
MYARRVNSGRGILFVIVLFGIAGFLVAHGLFSTTVPDSFDPAIPSMGDDASELAPEPYPDPSPSPEPNPTPDPGPLPNATLSAAPSTTLNSDGVDHVNTFVWQSFDGTPLRATLRVSIADAERSLREWGLPTGFFAQVDAQQNRAYEEAVHEFNARNASITLERNQRATQAHAEFVKRHENAHAAYSVTVAQPNQTPRDFEEAFAALEATQQSLVREYEATIEALDAQLKRDREHDDARYRERLTAIEREHQTLISTTLAQGCCEIKENSLFYNAACVVARDTPRLQRASTQLLQSLSRSCATIQSAQDAALAMVATAMEYRVPDDPEGNRETFGMLPPATCLARGWGDCDTKALLLATLIRDWATQSGQRSRCIAVLIPEHLLLGIQRTPMSGQYFVEFEGLPYVLMEAAGPASIPTGEIGESTKAFLDGGGAYTIWRVY